jgi:transposase
MEAHLEMLSKDQLIALLKEQRAKVDELEKKDIRQTTVILHMEQMINKLRRLHYGTKSERFLAESVVIANQLNLPFAELASKSQHADSEKLVKETITYTRAKNENHKGRNRLPEDLPAHEVVIEPAMPVEGMVKIGEERTEILELAPARFFKLVLVRPKYALPNSEGVIIGEMPSRPIEKCLAGNTLLSSILINKYVDHLPLYRQQQIFQRAGIQIASSTIDGWVAQLGALLEPLYEAMADVVRLDGYLQVDETPTRVLDNTKKGKCHLGYYWVYHAPPKRMVVFDYQRGRGKQGPRKMLDNYRGYLQTDGYTVYQEYAQKEEIVHLACWAHARRYFEQSRDQDKERAEYALEHIQQLYAIEREAKELNTAHRKTMRLEKSLPIINELGKWIARENKHVLPKSPIGKAFNYAVNSWDSLLSYLYNGELLIDNNLIENTIRPNALGRKNYLFAGSDDGAKRSAMFYTFTGTCKLNGVEPMAWLTEVLNRIADHKVNKLYELFPQNLQLPELMPYNNPPEL